MPTLAKSIPIKGYGNHLTNDTVASVRLASPGMESILKRVATPNLGDSDCETNFWWEESLYRVGLAEGNESISWSPKAILEYVFYIEFPLEFAGQCAFIALPRPLKKHERPPGDYFVAQLPYSSASLEKVLSIAAIISQLELGIVRIMQAGSARFW